MQRRRFENYSRKKLTSFTMQILGGSRASKNKTKQESTFCPDQTIVCAQCVGQKWSIKRTSQMKQNLWLQFKASACIYGQLEVSRTFSIFCWLTKDYILLFYLLKSSVRIITISFDPLPLSPQIVETEYFQLLQTIFLNSRIICAFCRK